MTNPMITPKTSMNHADPSVASKLVSLLALATGATALPQTSNADIIYTDLGSSPAQVGFLGGGALFMLDDLPGSVLFGFQRFETTVTTTMPITTTLVYRTVLAADMFGAAAGQIQVGAGGFASPLAYGQPWDQGLPLSFQAAVGVANTFGRSPTNGYDHQYLAFTFLDDSVGGGVRYGWIEVGLNIINVSPGSPKTGGPNVTIYGYAYDNTGIKPTMGQRPVPEPSSAALLVLGALTLGSRGLRDWRRNRASNKRV